MEHRDGRRGRILGGMVSQIVQNRSLVEVALETGFADQAHFSRLFKATFGITPARYRALSVPERSRPEWSGL
jgi:AraC-like DNA-binding protein